jgi:hypothetical protein
MRQEWRALDLHYFKEKSSIPDCSLGEYMRDPHIEDFNYSPEYQAASGNQIHLSNDPGKSRVSATIRLEPAFFMPFQRLLSLHCFLPS